MTTDHITDAMVQEAVDEFIASTRITVLGPTGAIRSAMRAALLAADRAAWQPTHRHRKGGLYRVIQRGRIEADLTPAVIYDDREGNVWVRPAAEFDDGRFSPLPPPPEPARD